MESEVIVGRLIREIGLKRLSIYGASAVSSFAFMVDGVLTGADVPKGERAKFKDQSELFAFGFSKIVNSDNNDLVEAAFEMVSSAIFISVYYAGGSTAIQRLRQKIEKERTKKANAARRQDNIREIVAKHSRFIWERDNLLKTKPHVTAYRIRKAVLKDVCMLRNVPEKWQFQNPEKLSAEDEKRVVENIRGYLRRVKLLDE
jgi:hypothetical protein